MQVSVFSVVINRALTLMEIRVVHGLWHKMDTKEKAASLSSCGKGVGSTWTDTSAEEGRPQL